MVCNGCKTDIPKEWAKKGGRDGQRVSEAFLVPETGGVSLLG